MSMSMTLILCLIIVQLWKHSDNIGKLLTGIKSIITNNINEALVFEPLKFYHIKQSILHVVSTNDTFMLVIATNLQH